LKSLLLATEDSVLGARLSLPVASSQPRSQLPRS
jgi:hypothetical protein